MLHACQIIIIIIVVVILLVIRPQGFIEQSQEIYEIYLITFKICTGNMDKN